MNKIKFKHDLEKRKKLVDLIVPIHLKLLALQSPYRDDALMYERVFGILNEEKNDEPTQ
jgi:hypothetical protein